MPINGWMDKQMWPIQTKEYYSAFKKEEILTRAITRMSLEEIIVSEISQSQKGK